MDINTTRLRCTIGWLAMLLPWLVVILHGAFPQSISITYFYPETVAVFMIIMGAACFLLMSYKGYGLQDDIINTIAGIMGLLVCLFPMDPDNGILNVGTFQISANISDIVHLIVAIIFFGLLSYNSLFLFTKSGGEMTPQKKKRNIIYRVCGIGMLASFLLMLIPSFYIQVWLVETIALLFFGISWLTKADYYSWLFADKK